MNLVWAAVGVAAGLVAGGLLRGTVFRLSVPAGAPGRAACPGCEARLHRWPAPRCPECGHTLGSPAVLELATAAVLALLAGRFGAQPLTLALGFLGALGVALAAIDLSVQRLPDRLTLPAYPALIALLRWPRSSRRSGTPPRRPPHSAPRAWRRRSPGAANRPTG